MIYILILFIISFSTLISVLLNRDFKILTIIIFFIITVMSIFRYGSGTDYFGYEYHYLVNPISLYDAVYYNSNINIGYRVLMAFFKSNGVNFQIFIGIISLFMMSIYLYVIVKNSKIYIISLLIFYSLYQAIYVESAIRQGIAMSIFFIAFFIFYKENKKKEYIFLIIIGGMFHYSVFIAITVPIIDIFYKKFFSNFLFNIVISVISIICFLLKGDLILIKVLNYLGLNINYSSGTLNILAILLRIVIILFLFLLYKFSCENRVDNFNKKCIYIYFINTLIFIAFSNMGILSRATDILCLIDVILIPNLIWANNNKLIKLLGIIFIIFVMNTNFIKDKISFLNQGSYFDKNILNYPYVSVFNKNDIAKYRVINYFEIE